MKRDLFREEIEDLLPHIEDDLRGAFEMNREQEARFNALMRPYWLVAQPVEVDELIHTDERPFCQDMTCPCHEDQELIEEYIAEHLRTGHLTEREAKRLYRGQQIR
jgi:hypothetical protein